jgi:hypothetical protein
MMDDRKGDDKMKDKSTPKMEKNKEISQEIGDAEEAALLRDYKRKERLARARAFCICCFSPCPQLLLSLLLPGRQSLDVTVNAR